MPKIIAISGEIGWDVWPDQIREQLPKDGSDVEFQISSPGGYVYDGLEIFNLIKNYEGNTTARIIGMAASMASYIPLAADKVIAESNAIYMIHNASAFAGGDQNRLRKVANILEGLSNLIGQEYIKQTGKNKAEIAKLMDAETYFFGNEIMDAGFVDEIADVEAEETAKDDLIINAMLKVEAVNEKIKAKSEDLDKIAALLPKNQASEPVKKSVQRSSAKIETEKEEKHMDPKTMTLDEFLAQNVAAKVLNDQRLADEKEKSKAEGKKEGIEEKQADIDRIHPLISAEGASPALIQSGFDAFKSGDVNTFVGIASYETRQKEEEKAKLADEEQEDDTQTGETKLSADGAIRNPEDLEAEKALHNKMKGKKAEAK